MNWIVNKSYSKIICQYKLFKKSSLKIYNAVNLNLEQYFCYRLQKFIKFHYIVSKDFVVACKHARKLMKYFLITHRKRKLITSFHILVYY